MIKKEHEELLINELEDLLENARNKISTVKNVTAEKQIFCCTVTQILKEAKEIVKTEAVKLDAIYIDTDEGNTYLTWKTIKNKTEEEFEADINRYFTGNCFTRIYKLLTPIGYARQCNVNMTIDVYDSMLSKDYASIIKYYGTRFRLPD